MPTHATTARPSTSSRAAPRRSPARDAIQLLRADHRKVQELFGRFEKARDEGRKAELAERICAELKVHAQIEEEIF